MDYEISRRIWITRYLMVIGIVVLHVPPYQPLSEISGSFFDFVKAFFSHGMFRTTVPVLTAISGFLVFSFGLHLQPKKLFVKKSYSLLIPLLIWNIPLAFTIFVIQKYELFSHAFSAKLYPVDTLSWVNAVTGALEPPVNFPLNFLRDLFLIALLSPIFWQLLKRIPYLGLGVVLVVYYFNLDGPLVLRNSMLVSFYIGGLAACQRWNLAYLDRYAKILFFLFVALCAAVVFLRLENREFLRIISPMLVWPSMSLVEKGKFGELLHRYSRNSFFTFLAHGPILLVSWLFFERVHVYIPYYAYWFMTPVLVVVLGIWLNKQFKERMPLVASFALGGR